LPRFVLLFFVIFIFSCQKEDIPQELLTPSITVATPLDNIKTGSTVLITGENLGAELSKIIVKLDSLKIAPVSINGQSLTFVIPGDMISAGSKNVTLTVIVNEVASNAVELTVHFAQQGWRYISKNFAIPNNPVPTFMHFYSDDVGLIFGRDLLRSTNDGGAVWGGIWSYSHLGQAFHAYSDNETWIEENEFDLLTFNYTNNTGAYARIDTITSISALTKRKITGLFVTQPAHGYMLTGDGSIFNVNGSFAPQNIKLDYQYSKYIPSSGIQGATDFYQLKGLDDMNFMAISRQKENGVVKPVIIHKQNGVYREYDLSQILEPGLRPIELHYVDAQTAYFISSDLSLYKLDFSKKEWVKTNTSALSTICFVNANLAYGASMNIYGTDYEYIYKTTDGAKTWNLDFSLDRFQRVTTLAAKDGKVWGFGISPFGDFVVKYVP
jgi:hypothetical protein